MADDCPDCPELRARLGATAGNLTALADFIDAERVEPTMPWRDLLPLIATRARNLAELAQGRY